MEYSQLNSNSCITARSRSCHVEDIILLIKTFNETNCINVDGSRITVAHVTALGRKTQVKVRLDNHGVNCRERVERCSLWVQEKAKGGADIYGVTTGFGACSSKRTNQLSELQEALIRCLLAGVFTGPSSSPGELSPITTRCAMFLRMSSFIYGCSGIRWEIMEALQQLINSHITPKCPLRGSVSASGDLIPLAYIAGLLIGNSQVKARIGVHGEEQEVPAPEALMKAGLQPFKLQAKEGLALVNGTSFATALAATVMYDANVLLLLVEMLCGMFCEVIFGREEFAHPLIHEMKPHPGQTESAALLEWLLRDSPFQELSREYYSINSLKKPRQDRYALRSSPQWLAPLVQTIREATATIETEINSANDNPIIDPVNGKALHGANFQGSAVGFYMDYVRVALAGLGKLVFAQFTELMIEFYSNGLPGNLSLGPDLSLDYGFKGIDIAMAAYSSELQFLANPVTTHVHSAEQHNQDINSLALISARKTEEALDILKLMLASHLYALCQAIDLRQLEQILLNIVLGIISSVSDECHLPESIKERLINVARGIPVYTYLESPCNSSLPLVSALKQTFLDAIVTFHDIQIVEQITEFESHLKQRLEEEITAIVLSYEERTNSHMLEGSCCRTLIHGSKFFPLYAFIREELNAIMMTPRTDHTPQEGTQKVFDAMVDGRITAPLLQCLNGFIN